MSALHTMDIDILLLRGPGAERAGRPALPHLLLHERGFVLRPLADIAPDLEHPVLYQTIRELLEELSATSTRCARAPYPRRWFEG